MENKEDLDLDFYKERSGQGGNRIAGVVLALILLAGVLLGVLVFGKVKEWWGILKSESFWEEIFKEEKKEKSPKEVLDQGNEATASSEVKIVITIAPKKEAEATPTVYKPYVSSKPVCFEYKIREGEFASDKCYSQEDYEDLIYYLNRFNSAVFNYEAAVSGMEITCSGSDFFKDACEEDKQQKAQAEGEMVQYREIINGIMARGQEID